MKKNAQLLLVILLSCAASSYSMNPALENKVTLASAAKHDNETRINATVTAAPAAAAATKPFATNSADLRALKRELLGNLLSLAYTLKQEEALNALTLFFPGDPDNDKLAQSVAEKAAALKAVEDKEKKEQEDARAELNQLIAQLKLNNEQRLAMAAGDKTIGTK